MNGKKKRPDRPAATEWGRIASDELSGQFRRTTREWHQTTNKRWEGESGNDGRPAKPSLAARALTTRNVATIIGAIALVTMAAYGLVEVSTGQTQHPAAVVAPQVTVPMNTPIKVASTPTATATATPHPTWTPRPKPPTPTPLPVATKAEPTPTVDMTTHYVDLFASCNGQYTGETEEKRRQAAQHTLKVSYRTLPEIIEIVEAKCQ